MPLITHPHTQAELVRSPVRGQEEEQLDVVNLFQEQYYGFIEAAFLTQCSHCLICTILAVSTDVV